MKYLVLIFSAVLMISCVSHRGLLTSSSILPNNKNYEFVNIAVGYSKVSYFLGIGGFKNDAFINDAKRNLIYSNPLKNGQSFENLTLDLKTTLFWPYAKVEAIVIADIIERDTLMKVKYNQGYLDLLSKRNYQTKKFLTLNELILFHDDHNAGTDYQARVVKLNQNSITLFYVNVNGSIQIKNIGYDRIFKTSNLDEIQKMIGFKVGEKVKFGYNGGLILGLNYKYALVKVSRYTTITVKIKDLVKTS